VRYVRPVFAFCSRVGWALPGVALVSLLGASVALGAPEAPVQTPPGADESAASNVGGFSHIRTDKVQFNINTGDFTIPDHFTATREGSDITADHATGNSKQKTLHAEGHVVVHETRAPTSSSKATDATQRPSTLTCDRLDVDGVKKVYYATGNMHFTQEGGREATSDSAVLDDSAHHLHLEGHVHVKNGDQFIDGDTLDYDTQSGQVDANGNVTITAPVQTPSPGPAVSAAPKKKKKGLL
jgi:lipopolysaccharide assembly outer membrane protein LptD (OstA)